MKKKKTQRKLKQITNKLISRLNMIGSSDFYEISKHTYTLLKLFNLGIRLKTHNVFNHSISYILGFVRNFLQRELEEDKKWQHNFPQNAWITCEKRKEKPLFLKFY